MVGVLHTHTDKFGYLSRCVHKHSHTEGNTQVFKNRRVKWLQNVGIRTQKLATKQMRANTRNQCKRGASHPSERTASEGTEGPVYTELGSRPHEAQSSGGVRETEVESEGRRGGADGSAIWWMEEKRGR